MARGHLSNGVHRCQGTAWGEELDGGKLYGALDNERDLELRGPTVSWNIVHMVNPSLNIYMKYGIMTILKGWCSPFVPLYTPNVLSFSRGLCCHAFGHVAFENKCVT